MTTKTATVEVEHNDGVLVLTRFFDAPPERVFEAWTQPEHFARWFGPKGGSVPHCTVDLRVGGVMHFCVQEPQHGERIWGKWIFEEIRKPERLVFRDYFSDEQGNITERPGFPHETLITVTFADHDGGTRAVIRHDGLSVDQGEVQGWKDGFDRLDALLEHLTND